MRCKLRPELAADASRQHDQKCRLKSSQYTFIIPHRVIQLTTISFWVSETRLPLPQVNKFPLKRVKNLATSSSIFIFIFSSSTGELCSQPITGNDCQIGRMFPEHVERSFLDPEYSFDEYFQLGSRRKVRPIKKQLGSSKTSNQVHEQTFAQLRTGFRLVSRGPRFESASALLSLEKLWSVDTVLWLCRSQLMKH